MRERKTGDFIEAVADFWLGMAGAASHGFAEMTKLRQDRKRKEQETGAVPQAGDLVDDFTLGMNAAFGRAKEVVERAVADLGPPEADGRSEKVTTETDVPPAAAGSRRP
jgi:hypothetical protein